MRYLLKIIGISILFFGLNEAIFAQEISANPPNEWKINLTMKTDFKTEKVNIANHPEFFTKKKEYFYQDQKVLPQKRTYCTEADVWGEQKYELADAPEDIQEKQIWDINLNAVKTYLNNVIVPKWNKNPQNVKISLKQEIPSLGEMASLKLSDEFKITSPNDGKDYETEEAELILSGTAPINTAKIIVSDYQLQAYKKGEKTWSYKISKENGNRVTKRYLVKAFDDQGKLIGKDTIFIKFKGAKDAMNDIDQEEVKLAQSIRKDDVIFEGVGVFGEKIDLDASAKIIKKAIKENINFVTLKVDKIPPQVLVEDEKLKKIGIKELIAIGESDFSGSPYNRIHNITQGANTFNGIIIPKGKIFSFNNTLGPVTGATGYKQELVIKGEETIPDYGGGLCQVSTTTFRAAMLAGLEIIERWPHAYAVSYYKPWGSDATIYLGGKNLRFKNDTDGAILIQTNINNDNHLLYFNFYGTKDNRRIALFGPYVGGWKGALASKTKYSDKLAPGQKKIVSSAHGGFNATWFRVVDNCKKEYAEKIFSPFEARGLITLIGGKNPNAANGVISEEIAR